MSDTSTWFLNLISQLQSHEIGNGERLKLIKEYLQNGTAINQSDKNYLIVKFAELQKIREVSPMEIDELKSKFEASLKQDSIIKEIKPEVSNDSEEMIKLKDQIKNLNEEVENFKNKEKTKFLKPKSIKEKTKFLKPKSIKEKSLSITLALSLFPALFGIQGLGHLYVNKVRKGIVILLISLFLFILGIAYWPNGVFFLIYFIIFIWQISNSRKLCKQYNINVSREYNTNLGKEYNTKSEKRSPA